MGDVLSNMFMLTASMRRYLHENNPKDKVYLEFISSMLLNKMHTSFVEILQNLPFRFVFSPLLWLLKFNTFSNVPSDKLRHDIASMVGSDSEQKHKLASNMYFPKDENEQLNILERAYESINETEEIAKKVRPFRDVDLALKENAINEEEAVLLRKSIDLRHQAIMVDSFKHEDYFKNK